VSALEKILKRQPKHPGANHDYILALEASPHPEKALASAERLADLMPGSGHMVHLPSHIYQRLGRYEEAAALDLKAVEADRRYLANINPRGFFLAYSAHHFHCLSSTALMRGRAAEAIPTARAGAVGRHGGRQLRPGAARHRGRIADWNGGGPARQGRRGGESPRAGGAWRGQPELRRALGLGQSGSSPARGSAPPVGASGAGRGGVPRGPPAPSRERLGALRPVRKPATGRQGGRGREDAPALQARLGGRGRDLQRDALLAWTTDRHRAAPAPCPRSRRRASASPRDSTPERRPAGSGAAGG